MTNQLSHAISYLNTRRQIELKTEIIHAGTNSRCIACGKAADQSAHIICAEETFLGSDTRLTFPGFVETKQSWQYRSPREEAFPVCLYCVKKEFLTSVLLTAFILVPAIAAISIPLTAICFVALTSFNISQQKALSICFLIGIALSITCLLLTYFREKVLWKDLPRRTLIERYSFILARRVMNKKTSGMGLHYFTEEEYFMLKKTGKLPGSL